MAHHVYNTEGFILDSSALGEANKIYLVFTRELGMVRATAQGVRFLKSKLRYSLQDFSLVKISLVRGKDLWRITNAKVEDNLYTLYAGNKEIMRVIAHVFLLIKRLIPGEEKNEVLFDILHQAFNFLKENPDEAMFTKEQTRAFEYILVLKILNNLGYVAYIQELQAFTTDSWSLELLLAMQTQKKRALEEINRSLKETQL